MYAVASSNREELGLALGAWFAEHQQLPLTPPYTIIAWFKTPTSEEPVAAAVFNDYTGSSIEFHFYGPRQINRTILSTVGDYVFNQLKCNIFIAKIPRKHKQLKQILPKIGFKYLTVIPQYYGPDKQEDAIMYYYKRENMGKWVK